MEFLSMYQRQLQILGCVVLAMLLGAVLGLEREMAHKPTGLRTHMLVAGAAALLMGLGNVILDRFDIHLGHTDMEFDPCALLKPLSRAQAFSGRERSSAVAQPMWWKG